MRSLHGALTAVFLAVLFTIFSQNASASSRNQWRDLITVERSGQYQTKPLRILLFVKAAGWRHLSIPAGEQFFIAQAEARGWDLRIESDADVFSNAVLENTDVVVFLQTTGTIFTASWQHRALKRFIERGGGSVGIHGASDGDEGWEWYRNLLGAYFISHPEVQEAQVLVHANHAISDPFPRRWTIMDEWYNFDRNPAELENVTVLLCVNEDTYEGGWMGRFHPISWCRDYDGGRSFYTSLGHREALYTNPYYKPFQDHIIAGILWAAGGTNESIHTDPIVFPSPTSSPVSQLATRAEPSASNTSSEDLVETTPLPEFSEVESIFPSPPVRSENENKLRVLVFNQGVTASESALEFLDKTASSREWLLEKSSNASVFSHATLLHFDVVVWLDSSGDRLNVEQRQAFIRFIRSGKGYVGVNSAIEAEPSWQYYKNLLGTSGAPTGDMDRKTIEVRQWHETVNMIPKKWTVADRWYRFDPDLLAGTNLLLSSTDHSPIAWCREFDRGRVWYTALGHRDVLYSSESYFKPFQEHLVAGIEWAAGISG